MNNLHEQLQPLQNQTNLYKKRALDISNDKVNFKSLLLKYPNVDISSMGFIEEWQNLDIWKDYE